MLRTAVSMTAAALATTVAVAACGPVRMGSAAIVGSQRISTATLTAQVANLESAYRASKVRIQLQFPQSQAPQEVLGWLVRFRVGERLGARNHITVTLGESQRALASVTARAQQSGAGKIRLADLAVANGLPPDLLSELGRYLAIQSAVVRKLNGGVMPADPSALQNLSREFSREQCLAAKSLRIQVNPQFGRLDYTRLSIVPAALTLSAPQAPVPSSSPSGLAPAC